MTGSTILPGNVFSNAPKCGIFFVLIAILTAQFLAESTGKMQAWQMYSYGDSKQLQLQEVRIPNISDSNQLLVKVRAVALNPIDLEILGGYGKLLRGYLEWFKTVFPLILGREFAGTVIDKGSSVTDDEFKIGTDVYGIIPIEKQGSLREYLLADKLQVLPRPVGFSVTEAGSLLYTSITAWCALFSTGGLANQKDLSKVQVLILGASGGVGTVAVQMLKSQNVTVVGTCSTDAVPLVTSLGADFVHDYKDPKYVADVASHGIYDIILDCAKFGHENVPNDWKFKTFIALNAPIINNIDKLGILAGLAVSGGQLVSANVHRIFGKKSVQWAFFSPHPDAFKFIDRLVRNKQLKPIVQKVYNFSQVPDAFNTMAAGHLRGKIVIDLQ